MENELKRAENARNKIVRMKIFEKGKKLSEMSLEELWQLFPIVLTEHQPCWAEWYDSEVQSLKEVLPNDARFYHVGSTAINGIWAKPIIDIIVAVSDVNAMRQCADILSECGYIVMSEADGRVSLNKGYTESGFAERVFHLHIRLNDDIDEVYFKDYLNECPEIAKEYEALKLRLWKEFEHNRDAYTNAKTDFVNKYTRLAKELYIKNNE